MKEKKPTPNHLFCTEHKKLSASPIQSNPLKSALTSVSSCSNEMNWSFELQRPLLKCKSQNAKERY